MDFYRYCRFTERTSVSEKNCKTEEKQTFAYRERHSSGNISSVLQCRRRRWTSIVVRCSSITEQVTHLNQWFAFKSEYSFWFDRYKDIRLTIYTGDVDATPKAILTKAKNTFNVSVDEDRVDFVFLTKRNWIEAEKYPYFTLLGQSLGSVWVGIEALLKFQPGNDPPATMMQSTFLQWNKIFLIFTSQTCISTQWAMLSLCHCSNILADAKWDVTFIIPPSVRTCWGVSKPECSSTITEVLWPRIRF